jgi:hypothetical protein
LRESFGAASPREGVAPKRRPREGGPTATFAHPCSPTRVSYGGQAHAKVSTIAAKPRRWTPATHVEFRLRLAGPFFWLEQTDACGS